MDIKYCDFEAQVAEMEQRIQELGTFPAADGVDFSAELSKLRARRDQLLGDIYTRLTPWQRVQVARHPQRPYFLDYVRMMSDDFEELHGDRLFGDDKAIVTGFAAIAGVQMALIGQQKGNDVKENLARNFGMPRPEGYRKALRVMKLAEKFRLPLVTIIDTPGAYPGMDAEERGQGEAIARNLREMAMLATPIVSIVIGEGGSGGALAIGIADRFIMLENSIYSVISPEGCASILWHDSGKAEEAANALGITAKELRRLKVADEVLAEPLGGAHRDPLAMAENLKQSILRNLSELSRLPRHRLVEKRLEKIRSIGPVLEHL
ncbi:MAG: acetyl-CoA carboxylase carboxyltransferase subunit alpha [Spirochaetota bacterium]|jgi:acetyl-CoA carboxylase carboxyl transferase subunit alpha|nr:acetyl-CoA carboxylase carboxyltransferase subunit alpha [Spirochaetota bacterium]